MTRPEDMLLPPAAVGGATAGRSTAGGAIGGAGASVPGASVDVSGAVIDGVDVDAVAAAVQGCAGVSALVGGRFGEVVTYLPSRKVAGVLIRDGRIEVQVRSQWGVPAVDLAALITVILVPLTGHRPVDVVIADIDDPPGTPSFPLTGCE
jgi:hypothetical protein